MTEVYKLFINVFTNISTAVQWAYWIRLIFICLARWFSLSPGHFAYCWTCTGTLPGQLPSVVRWQKAIRIFLEPQNLHSYLLIATYSERHLLYWIAYNSVDLHLVCYCIGGRSGSTAKVAAVKFSVQGFLMSNVNSSRIITRVRRSNYISRIY